MCPTDVTVQFVKGRLNRIFHTGKSNIHRQESWHWTLVALFFLRVMLEDGSADTF